MTSAIRWHRLLNGIIVGPELWQGGADGHGTASGKRGAEMRVKISGREEKESQCLLFE